MLARISGLKVLVAFGLVAGIALPAVGLAETWNAISDPSFEEGSPGNPFWIEQSDVFGTVIRDQPGSGHTGTDSVRHIVQVSSGLIMADFSWQPNFPAVDEPVNFTDLSTGDVDTWHWDFGDGSTSEDPQPQHTFAATGEYVVTLTVSDSQSGAMDSAEKIVPVILMTRADFTWEPLSPVAGETVLFTGSWSGEPEPDSFTWTFPGGVQMHGPEVQFIFEEAGTYSVTFELESDGLPPVGVNKSIHVLSSSVGVDFNWEPIEPVVGEPVSFMDLSSPVPVAWSWDFGDGTASEEQHPVHAYAESGQYEVILTATLDAAGTDVRHLSKSIMVREDEFIADFMWDPEEITAGQLVEFFDQSQGGALAWHWDFGDGRSSRQRNPSHRFTEAGAYNVTLTVRFDAAGTIVRSAVKSVQVHKRDLEAGFIWSPLEPRANQEVQFVDTSRGGPEAWHWDFGDGTSSDESNPIHVFGAPGEYFVELTVGRPWQTTWLESRVTMAIRVIKPLDVEFTWQPVEPRARTPVEFIELAEFEISERFWSFGDGSSTTDPDPVHVYDEQGTYLVQLWARHADEGTIAVQSHEITVRPSEREIVLLASKEQVEIGDAVGFAIEGVEEVDAVEWHFGGLGCDGTTAPVLCIPDENQDCLTATYSYSNPGPKPARVFLQVDGAEVGPLMRPIQVVPGGTCGAPPQAEFDWWPTEPKAGEPVRCVDLSTGPPTSWLWTFPNGATSDEQHVRWAFSKEGRYPVQLEVENEAGRSSVVIEIEVAPNDGTCGNGVCDPGENSWSCPGDCRPDEDGTGRMGRKHSRLNIPAAVGGVEGDNQTYWITEGTLYNPGVEDAEVVAHFYPDSGGGEPRVIGPEILPAETAVHFDNLVEELFGVASAGSIVVDANIPIIANTRTFNQTENGTFGQGIVASTSAELLREGDGEVFLVGLRHNQNFRTNLLFQEVAGKEVTVDVEVYDGAGTLVGQRSVGIEAWSRWQKSLVSANVGQIEFGYAVVSVRGEGAVTALASVIDQDTGDATTIDAVHRIQAELQGSQKAEGDEEPHFLVAVVAHTPGTNETTWRSEVTILNPEETDQSLELHYVQDSGEILVASVDVESGALFATEDVVAEVFEEAPDGTGSLHVYGQGGLVVNSRTYNEISSDSTVGQAIPGLASGDMARPGEVWIIDSLKDTKDFRCNMGFAEFEGSDAEVSVLLFDVNAFNLLYLGSKTYEVPAFSQIQVNRVFDDMGLEEEYSEALAIFSLASEAGALYVYASVVDNEQGDGTTILGKRK